MNLENIMLSEKSYTKGHIFSDSIYMKCPERANPQRQKADWWLPRAGVLGDGRESVTVMGMKFLFEGTVLKLDCSDIVQFCKYTKKKEKKTELSV